MKGVEDVTLHIDRLAHDKRVLVDSYTSYVMDYYQMRNEDRLNKDARLNGSPRILEDYFGIFFQNYKETNKYRDKQWQIHV